MSQEERIYYVATIATSEERARKALEQELRAGRLRTVNGTPSGQIRDLYGVEPTQADCTQAVKERLMEIRPDLLTGEMYYHTSREGRQALKATQS